MSSCLAESGQDVGVKLLDDREVLCRLIQYARAEAEGGGQTICAQLLAAALLVLEMSPEEANRWCLEMVHEPAFAS